MASTRCFIRGLSVFRSRSFLIELLFWMFVCLFCGCGLFCDLFSCGSALICFCRAALHVLK